MQIYNTQQQKKDLEREAKKQGKSMSKLLWEAFYKLIHEN